MSLPIARWCGWRTPAVAWYSLTARIQLWRSFKQLKCARSTPARIIRDHSLDGLEPATRYYYRAMTEGQKGRAGGELRHGAPHG